MGNIFSTLIISTYSFHRLVASFWPQRVPASSIDFYSGWCSVLPCSQACQLHLGGVYSHLDLLQISPTFIYVYGFPYAFSSLETISKLSFFFFPMHVYVYGNNYKCNYVIFPYLCVFFFLFLCSGRRWWCRGLGSQVFGLSSEDIKTPNSYFFNDQGLRFIFITDNVWVV